MKQKFGISTFLVAQDSRYTVANWGLNRDCIARQGPIVELLTQWKAQVDQDNAAGELCDASSR